MNRLDKILKGQTVDKVETIKDSDGDTGYKLHCASGVTVTFYGGAVTPDFVVWIAENSTEYLSGKSNG